MNLFGKKKAAPAPDIIGSIKQLTEVQALLDKREDHLQKQIKQATFDAQTKLKAKDKNGAIFCIKRKKMYQTEVDQIYAKKSNIETQIITLQGTQINKEVLNAMRSANNAMKASIKEADIEKVEDLMSDVTEGMAMANEIGTALANPIGPAVDEDELEDELKAMEAEMLDSELLEAPSVPAARRTDYSADALAAKTREADREAAQIASALQSAPAVPSNPIKTPALSKEEAELQELGMEMGQ